MEEKSDISPYFNLLVDEGKYKTLSTPKFERRKPHLPVNKKLITAFIPGTTRKVFVKDGSKVKKGEVLVQLEAMKMINNLFAPFNGTIKKVHVKEGEIVGKNATMIEFK